MSEYVNAGFNILELGFYNDNAFPWENAEQVKKLHNIVDDMGVKIWSIHPPDRGGLSSLDPASRKTQLEIVKRFVDIAQDFGAPTIPLHVGIKLTDGAKSPELLRESMQELAEYTQKTSVTLCLETSAGDLTNHQAFEEVKKASQSAFGIVIDTGHSNIAGDLYGSPQLAGRRLYYLHIHDNDGKSDQHQIPEDGIIDWKRFMQDLQAADYCGPLMLESAPGGKLKDVLARAKQSAEYLLGLRK